MEYQALTPAETKSSNRWRRGPGPLGLALLLFFALKGLLWILLPALVLWLGF